MDTKQIIKKLESSDEFVRWKKSNQNTYLTHALNMLDEHCFSGWQLGYYNKSSNKITVFEMGDRINICPEQEVFKEESTLVKPLDIKKVKVELNQALESANKLIKDKYSKISFNKAVIILQNIEIGQVWNLTFIGKSFDVLNIKISSESGKVLSHDLKPLFELDGTKKS